MELFAEGGKKDKKDKKKDKTSQLEYNRYITKKLSELSERVRIMEQKLSTTREKIHVVDENMLMKTRDLRDDMNRISIESKEMKRSVAEMNDAIQHLVKMVSESAKNRDLQVLEKYINMIDPTRFLTKKDVISIIQEIGMKKG